MVATKNIFKILLVTLLLGLFSFRLWQSTGCKNFNSLRFNPNVLIAGVESQRNLDVGIPIPVSKLLHNKVTEALTQVSSRYLNTFKPKFLLEILGPLGLFCALLSAALTIRTRKKSQIFSLLGIFISSVAAIVLTQPKISLLLIFASWAVFASLSINFVIRSKMLLVLFFLLFVYTYFFYSINWQMPVICNEIFFN